MNQSPTLGDAKKLSKIICCAYAKTLVRQTLLGPHLELAMNHCHYKFIEELKTYKEKIMRTKETCPKRESRNRKSMGARRVNGSQVRKKSKRW